MPNDTKKQAPGDAAAEAERKAEAQQAADAARDAERRAEAECNTRDAAAEGRGAAARPGDMTDEQRAAEAERLRASPGAQQEAPDDEAHAEEMERRRQYDEDRARRMAASNLDHIHAHAVAQGLDPEEAADEIDAALASRSPRTALTGALAADGLRGVQREVGAQPLAPPTGQNYPSSAPPARGAPLPPGNGKKVTSRDPRFEGQELVDMTFMHPVTLTLDDQSTVDFRPGTQGVPETLVDHWYLRVNGARRYDEAA